MPVTVGRLGLGVMVDICEKLKQRILELHRKHYMDAANVGLNPQLVITFSYEGWTKFRASNESKYIEIYSDFSQTYMGHKVYVLPGQKEDFLVSSS